MTLGGWTRSPSPARSRAMFSCADNALTWRLTGSRPTIRSSSASASASSTGSLGPAGNGCGDD